MDYKSKLFNLRSILEKMEKVIIAYSGGVDSSLVLAVALDVLGKENVLSVVVDSDLLVDDEYSEAISNSESIGANTKGIYLDELSVPEIRNNEPSSWYYSKRLLYETLDELKVKHSFFYVVDGMIMDDTFDFRPGLKARDDFHVRSILQEADFYKTDVRLAAKEYGIPTWNKVPSCSIISRFEYNDKLTKGRIERVKSAEQYLKQLGFSVVRVRDHNTVARIEIKKDEFDYFFKLSEKIEDKLLSIGYSFVALDIKGYSYGKMNRLLSNE
ncbi:PP-loop superfamily ATP-binding protein [Tetragenococcus halophilus subsp. flandriensis]|uniref:ATP-dependent sacrificial sulfur transferase LarE n=1 Tax=Tetragenococcus halophilus TaxID=51669 RepID=UPI0023E9C9E0|nr:ATP-dependent sacrificial sulfur transferase LarE [Tetragenococcus halophilus]GMA08464.1 PP-loop superfamily ATP-binding protein [Tetragenococcus halophilus subsp. flandriensis]